MTYVNLALQQLNRANEDLSGARTLCVALVTANLAVLITVAVIAATLEAGGHHPAYWWSPLPAFGLSTTLALLGSYPFRALKSDAGPLTEDIETRIARAILDKRPDPDQYVLSVRLQLLAELQAARRRCGQREGIVTGLFAVAAGLAGVGFLVALLFFFHYVP